MSLQGKKLLVLGGARQHCKIVEAAREMGVVTYVADWLASSPAKNLADYALQMDIFDIPALARLCRSEGIEGALAAWLDPCQQPYFNLCSELGYHCYGSREAFRVMTSKPLFKDYCKKHGVGTIPYWSGTATDLQAFVSDIELPAYVKPGSSRGSRGQTVCWNTRELSDAIANAVAASSDGQAVVEKYIEGAEDISVTYFFVDGVPHVERLSDRLLGSRSDGLDNVAIGSVSPSAVADRYMDEANTKVVSMLKSLGCAWGPVFMQGFANEDGFFFYDPGLRFPGGDYERAVKVALGVDYAKLLVEFALTGRMPSADQLAFGGEDVYRLNGKFEVIHDITLRPGIITSIEGLSEVTSMTGVVSAALQYSPGDIVSDDLNVVRRAAEINYLVDSVDCAVELSTDIDKTVLFLDAAGDMKISLAANGLRAWRDRWAHGRE